MTTDTQIETIAEEIEAAAVPASLTIQDLSNLRNIIDVASQRGAFKTTEFTMVGDTYSKLANFIAAITPADKKEEGTDEKAAAEVANKKEEGTDEKAAAEVAGE